MHGFAGLFLCGTSLKRVLARCQQPLSGTKPLQEVVHAPTAPGTRDLPRTGDSARLSGRTLGYFGVGEREVASGHVSAVFRLQERLLDRAHLLAFGATGVEPAGGRRIGRAGDVAAQDTALALQ